MLIPARQNMAAYLEMPGMRLPTGQVQRLSGVDISTCAMVLEDLVRAQFLHVRQDGSYGRAATVFPRDQESRGISGTRARFRLRRGARADPSSSDARSLVGFASQCHTGPRNDDTVRRTLLLNRQIPDQSSASIFRRNVRPPLTTRAFARATAAP